MLNLGFRFVSYVNLMPERGKGGARDVGNNETETVCVCPWRRPLAKLTQLTTMNKKLSLFQTVHSMSGRLVFTPLHNNCGTMGFKSGIRTLRVFVQDSETKTTLSRH